MFNRIVHVNDGSENAFTALKVAIDLASISETQLDVLFFDDFSAHAGMFTDFEAADATEQRHIRLRQAIAKRVAERHNVLVDTHVFVGHPVQQVVQFIEDRKSDLLVIGATEHANLWDHIFGRRSDRITHTVACSVLIVREGGHDAA